MTLDLLQKTMEGLLFNRSADLDVCAEQYMNIYLDAHKNHQVEKFCEESEKFSDQLDLLWEYFKIDEEETHRKIYYFAMIYTIKNLAVKISEDLSCDAGEYGNYKYIYPILKVLYENGAVSVGKLAECLKIERHNLTNAIRRYHKFQLWSQEKQGRNSLCQITAKGERAYASYLKKEVTEDKNSLEELLLVLLKEIETHMKEFQPDPNEIIRKLNSQMKGSVFSSPMMKVSIQNIYEKRLEFIKKIHQKKREMQRKDETEMFHRYSMQGLEPMDEFQGEDMYQYTRQIGQRLTYQPYVREKEVAYFG